MKNKTLKLTISLILVFVMLLSTTFVYAWLSSEAKRDFVDINNGQIKFATYLTKDGETVSDELVAKDLAFIDYTKDFVYDKYHMLSEMSTSYAIEIKADSDSLDIVNKLMFDYKMKAGTKTGIVYLFVIEGKNLDIPNHTFNTDYYSVIENLDAYESGEPTRKLKDVRDDDTLTDIEKNTIFRSSVAEANTLVHDTLLTSDYVLKANESVTVQIVLWGDYDNLPEADQNKLIGDNRKPGDENRIFFELRFVVESHQKKEFITEP